MYWFLLPLLIGFAFNSASAFSTYYSVRLGERYGRLVCIIFRDVLGIPVWATGYALAALTRTPGLFTPISLSSLLAGALAVSGVALIVAGLVSLRWRAAAPSLRDTLVRSGLYAHIRHPLYSGMFLELAGLFLWLPSQGMLVACLLGVFWIILQARLEEMDLLQRLPAYKDYMQQVPPFVPRLKF